jgi:hypothetical protein
MPFDKAAVVREMHLVDAEGRIYRGAAAILEILGRYPRWAFVSGIGRSPLVRPLLPLGYAIVAANRRFLFGPASRIFWLKATALIAFCIGLAISSPLWIGPRSYPPVPVWDAWPPTPRSRPALPGCSRWRRRRFFHQPKGLSQPSWQSFSCSVWAIRPAGSPGSF